MRDRRMKKAFFVCFFITLAGIIFAQSNLGEMKQSSRKIIYAVKPVEAIGAIKEIDDLYDFVVFAQISQLPSRKSDPNVLNETDAKLMEYLATVEIKRRELKKDDFSLYLQDVHEEISPLMKRNNAIANAYIKIDGWLDLFKLNLIFAD